MLDHLKEDVYPLAGQYNYLDDSLAFHTIAGPFWLVPVREAPCPVVQSHEHLHWQDKE